MESTLGAHHSRWRMESTLGADQVVISWEGDSQATAPISRKASTNVMACFGNEFRKRFVAFQPRIFFEFESFFFGIVVLF